MRYLLLLVMTGVFLPAGCTRTAVVTTYPLMSPTPVPARPVASPTPAPALEPVALPPVKTRVNKIGTRRKDFDDALPAKVRAFLETAETVEILAEGRIADGKMIFDGGDDMEFEASVHAFLQSGAEKRQLLEAFYRDVAHAGSVAACYLPHHKIVAVKGGERVEIEICYLCSRFSGKSPFGEFDGSFRREVPEAESEALLNRLLAATGVSMK